MELDSNAEKCTENEENVLSDSIKGYGFGVRHVQMAILFLCIICGSAVGSCLSLVILAMTDKSIHGDAIQTFDWDSQTIGVIQSASIWGDIPFQIASSVLVQKFGAKRIITLNMMTTGFLCITTPYSASKLGWMGIFANRLIQGLAQSSTYPCIHTLIGTWIPISERNRFGNFVYSGEYVSLVAVMPLTAFISTSFLGWPWVFYIFGGTSLLCGLLWMAYGAESPAHHPSISTEEKEYIQSSPGNENILRRTLKTPWKAILTSAAVWALIITQTGAAWGYTVMILETPTFLKEALGLDLQNSGFLTALPYGITWIVVQVTSMIADFLANKEYFTLTGVRRLMNTFGSLGPAFFLIILPFVPTSMIWLAVAIVALIAGADGISSAGYLLNHIDLSPNFGGVLISLANTISSSTCLLAPIISGYILKDPTDIEQWKIVFFISAGFYIIGNCAFLMYGSGEIQPFNLSYTLQESDDAEKIELQDNSL